MLRRTFSVAIALLSAAACISHPLDEGAGGSGEGAGGSHESCDVPDTSCPTVMPFSGAPCAGSLICDYDDGVVPWSFTCADGRWAGTADCSMIVGGACGVPGAAEACPAPFAGTLAGAEVVIGSADPATPFAALEDGSAATVAIGPQGGGMVYFRLRIDGHDVPSCVSVTITLTPSGKAPGSSERPLRLRCGESLTMYGLLPEEGCESNEPVETLLHVAVEGVGQSEVMLVVPGDVFCAALG